MLILKELYEKGFYRELLDQLEQLGNRKLSHKEQAENNYYKSRSLEHLGEFKKNHLIALLPMTRHADGQLALNRVTKKLNLEPLDVNGILLDIKVASVLAEPDLKQLTASVLMDQLSLQLKNMTTRLKNIHAF